MPIYVHPEDRHLVERDLTHLGLVDDETVPRGQIRVRHSVDEIIDIKDLEE